MKAKKKKENVKVIREKARRREGEDDQEQMEGKDKAAEKYNK
jgi:hypothetical protein